MARKQSIEPKSKVIQIRVSEELYEKFEVMANKKGITISNLGRELINAYDSNYKELLTFLYNLLTSGKFKLKSEYTPGELEKILKIEEVLKK